LGKRIDIIRDADFVVTVDNRRGVPGVVAPTQQRLDRAPAMRRRLMRSLLSRVDVLVVPVAQ